MVFTEHLADSGTANIFVSDSSPASERPPWWFLCRWQRVGKLFVELKILFSLWSSSVDEHGRLHVLLIFCTTSSEVYAKVEPCCYMKLCCIFGVRRTKLLHRFGSAFQLAVLRWPFYAQHHWFCLTFLVSWQMRVTFCLLQWEQGQQRYKTTCFLRENILAPL